MICASVKKALKQILKEEQVVAPSVWDCMTAHIAEQTGFKALFLSSSAFSEYGAGMPNVGLISPEDIVRRTETICLYTNLPLIVDCEFGAGETPLNTLRYVERLVHVGASAVCIEDTTGIRGEIRWMDCATGHFKKENPIQPVVPIETWLSKIAAAKEACSGTDCLVIAVTAVAIESGKEAAFYRAELAQKMGADIVWIKGLDTLEDATDFSNHISGSKVWSIAPSDADESVSTLAELGFNLVVAHIFEKPGFANMVEVGKRVCKEQTTVYSDSFRSPMKEDGTEYPPVGFGVKWLEKEDEFKQKARKIVEGDND